MAVRFRPHSSGCGRMTCWRPCFRTRSHARRTWSEKSASPITRWSTRRSRDCLHEAMDLDGLRAVLRAIERGDISTTAIDTAEPSPFSHEILNANPYAFLDDAPLEERRARAVQLRRTLPTSAQEIGALDATAIAEVAGESWPVVRSADELHDALLTLALVPPVSAWQAWYDELEQAGPRDHRRGRSGTTMGGDGTP